METAEKSTVAIAAEAVSGEAVRQWPDAGALCVDLEATRSPHVARLCLESVRVAWEMAPQLQGPVISATAQWSPLARIWLRAENGPQARDLEDFSQPVREAFAALRTTRLRLAADLRSEGPRRAAGASLLFEPAVGAKSDERPDAPVDLTPAWASFLVDGSLLNPCVHGRFLSGEPVYLPAETGRERLAGGANLSALTVCGLEVSGLDELNGALLANCEAWADPDARRTCREAVVAEADPLTPVPDRPRVSSVSLDALLTEIDETGSVSGPVDLDALLAEVEAVAEKKRQLASLGKPVTVASVGGAPDGGGAEAAATVDECTAKAQDFDRAVKVFVDWLDRPAGELAFTGGGGRCNTLIQSLNVDIAAASRDAASAYASGAESRGRLGRLATEISKCRVARNRLKDKIRRAMSKLSFDQCTFQGGNPKGQLKPLLTAVRLENSAFNKRIDHARRIDAALLDAAKLDKAEIWRRLEQDIRRSLASLGAEVTAALEGRARAYGALETWRQVRAGDQGRRPGAAARGGEEKVCDGLDSVDAYAACVGLDAPR